FGDSDPQPRSVPKLYGSRRPSPAFSAKREARIGPGASTRREALRGDRWERAEFCEALRGDRWERAEFCEALRGDRGERVEFCEALRGGRWERVEFYEALRTG